MFKFCAVLAVVALVPASQVEAATLVKSMAGAPDPGASGNLVINFDDPLPAGIVFAPGNQFSILQGLVAHQGYNPAVDLTKYLSVPGAGTSGSATLDFSGLTGKITDFSFYWGSVDRANTLTVTTNQGRLVVTGSDILAAGFGNATSARANRRVFFALDSAEILQSLTFASPTAFEVDDVILSHISPAPGVPEPASWMMMIAGFAVVGRMMRQRQVSDAALSLRRSGSGWIVIVELAR